MRTEVEAEASHSIREGIMEELFVFGGNTVGDLLEPSMAKAMDTTAGVGADLVNDRKRRRQPMEIFSVSEMKAGTHCGQKSQHQSSSSASSSEPTQRVVFDMNPDFSVETANYGFTIDIKKTPCVIYCQKTNEITDTRA